MRNPRKTLLWALVAMILALARSVGAGEDPAAKNLIASMLGGPDHQEIRAGCEIGWIELALAGTHQEIDAEATGLRAYILIHGVDANMIGQWFGHEVDLPAGSFYIGAYQGFIWPMNDWVNGPVVGTAWQVHPRAHLIFEYQMAWTGRQGEFFAAGLKVGF